jgi:hypothetical protein
VPAPLLAVALLAGGNGNGGGGRSNQAASEPPADRVTQVVVKDLSLSPAAISCLAIAFV